MAIQDERFTALRAQGFTGTNNDMLVQWAQAAGATSNQINDAVLEALLLNGATTPCLSDAWVEYLNSIGLTGSRNDMELGFWESGGLINPTSPIDEHWDRVSDKSDPTLFSDLSTLIDSLETAGVWNKLVDLSVVHTSAIDSLLGLKGVIDSTVVGNPFFSLNTGFVVGNDGVDRYIDTGISQGQDEVSGFTYRIGASAVDSGALGTMGSEDGASDHFVLSIINATQSDFTLANSSVTGLLPKGGNGFIGGSRVDASTASMIHSGTAQTVNVAAEGGAPNVNPMVVGGKRVDGVFETQLGTENVMAWGVGGSMTEQNLIDLNNAIDVYIAARTNALVPTPFDVHWARVTDKTDPKLESQLRKLFESLQNIGVYDLLDDLCVIHNNAADSILGLKGFQDSTLRNNPFFNLAFGFRFGNSGGTFWADTNIVDNGLTNLTTDSMSTFCYRVEASNVGAGSSGIMGVLGNADADTFMSIDSDTQSRYRFGHEDNAITFAQGGDGFIGGTRNSPTNTIAVKNSAFATSAQPSVATAPLTFPPYVGGINGKGPLIAASGTESICAWGVGGGLSQTQLIALENTITTYALARLEGHVFSPFDAHWARVTDKSDPTLEADLRQLFDDLINGGIYDLLEDLCVIHSTGADSRLGLKGVTDSTTVGNPSFNTTRGYRCGRGGGSFYVDSNLISAVGNKIQNNDASLFCYRAGRSTSTAGAFGTMGVNLGGGSDIFLQTNSNTLSTIRVQSSSTSMPVGGDGFFCGSRIGSNSGAIGRNGATLANTAPAIGNLPTNKTLLVGQLNQRFGTLHATATEDFTAWGAGGGLTEAQILILDAAITTYVTARGAS